MTLKILGFYCALIALNAFILAGVVTSAGLALILQWPSHVVNIVKIVDIATTVLTVSLDAITGLHWISAYMRLHAPVHEQQ